MYFCPLINDDFCIEKCPLFGNESKIPMSQLSSAFAIPMMYFYIGNTISAKVLLSAWGELGRDTYYVCSAWVGVGAGFSLLLWSLTREKISEREKNRAAYRKQEAKESGGK